MWPLDVVIPEGLNLLNKTATPPPKYKEQNINKDGLFLMNFVRINFINDIGAEQKFLNGANVG